MMAGPIGIVGGRAALIDEDLIDVVCPVCRSETCDDPNHAAPGEPAPRSARRPTPTLIDDVQILNTPATAMLVAERLPADALALLIGAPGIGKSFVGVDLAVATATGRQWLGAEVLRRGPVVWILAEGGPSRFGRRVAAGKKHAGLPLDRSIGIYTWPAAPTLMRQREVDALAAVVASIKPALVVLDTYSRCAAGADENSATDTGLIVAALDTLRGSGATVLALHHTPADGRSTPRGSSALLGAVDTVLTLTAADGRLRLACSKQRDGAPFSPLMLRLQPVADSVVPVLDGSASTESAPVIGDSLDARILETLAVGPTSGGRLARTLSHDRSLIFSRLNRLAAAGRIYQVGKGPSLRWRLS